MADYRILPGTPQEAFGKLRTPIQIFGGGYGNGKTAAAIVQKVLVIARDYPGANILVARSTYPKLNDTIRKEFLKWCPPSWIKSFPLSKNSDNTCTMKNGSTINFRYIAQQGKSSSEGEQTTSNLLSATYDLVVVDQLEDPEIVEKDFNDLLGRLRGSAKYIGNDPTMPLTGPRWFIGMLNPTRNWAYRRIVAPYLRYKSTGVVDEHLLVKRHPRDHELAGQPVLVDNKPILLISMVEGSTYTNAHNLDAGFMEVLESVYTGQAKDRYLYGEWAAYEGLVHPDFSEVSHLISRRDMYDYLDDLASRNIEPRFIEGYDFGITAPCCYLIGFADHRGNVFIIDGFYEPEEQFHIDQQQARIAKLRTEYGCPLSNFVKADPAIFKRSGANRRTSSKTVAQLFDEGSYAVKMVASDNTINSGITKVNMYLTEKRYHRHPITQMLDAPHLYIATELEFVSNEFTAYYWKSDSTGARIDEPIDRNDHAMNTIKYMLSTEPDLAVRLPRERTDKHLSRWSTAPERTIDTRGHRYG